MNNLLIDEYPLLILPSLAVKLGVTQAILLQQLHFWISKELNYKDNRYWVYNTYEGWHKQFPFLSISTIRRNLNKLEDDGLIITGNYNKMGFDNTKWYSLNYDEISKLCTQ